MDMLEFYKGTLKLGDLFADSDDMLSTNYCDTKPHPWTITGRRLVLPSPSQLKNPEWSNRYAFHPLVESQVGGESVIFERFRRAINYSMNLRMAFMFVSMARLCLSSNAEQRNTLGAAYNDMFHAMSSADDKFHNTVTKLLEKDVKFVHTYVRRGMTVAGESKRVGSETCFPFLESLMETKDRVIEGVKLRIDDVEMLKRMYEFVFPGCTTGTIISAGSDSPAVPTLLAQVHNSVLVYSRINDVFEKHPALGGESYVVDITPAGQWLGDISHIITEANSIGMLEGNLPKQKKTNGAIEVSANPAAPAPAATLPATPMINNQNVLPASQIQQPQQTHQVIGSAPPMQAVQKIGSPAPVASGVKANPATVTTQPRVIPSVHIGQQAQTTPMLMQTPTGIAAVQPVTMDQAKEIALRQQQAQQAQLQAQQANQMKLFQAQQLGYQTTQSPTGPLVMVSDGKGGVQYVPIAQWEPPAQVAGAPAMIPGVTTPAIPGMQQPMIPGMVQPVAAATPVTPGATVSIDQWMAGNPQMAATYNQNYLQQVQAQQMAQQMTQLQQMAAMGYNVAGMMPGVMGMAGVPNAQAGYVPSHMRAASMLPQGMITPIGGI